MITTYRRGHLALHVEYRVGESPVTFTIVRTGPLTPDDVRRINAELHDYSAAHGAHLIQSAQTGHWEVRADTDTVLASDNGDATAALTWVTA